MHELGQTTESTGTEWLWRLARNPRRLGTRYLRCALLLARLELGYRVGALASK